MFEVYNERTGDVIRKVRDAVTANRIAIDYTSAYAWINNDKFDYRTVNENSNNIREQIKRARNLVKGGNSQTNS